MCLSDWTHRAHSHLSPWKDEASNGAPRIVGAVSPRIVLESNLALARDDAAKFIVPTTAQRDTLDIGAHVFACPDIGAVIAPINLSNPADIHHQMPPVGRRRRWRSLSNSAISSANLRA